MNADERDIKQERLFCFIGVNRRSSAAHDLQLASKNKSAASPRAWVEAADPFGLGGVGYSDAELLLTAFTLRFADCEAFSGISTIAAQLVAAAEIH